MTMTSQGVATRRNDGKAVNVIVPTGQTWKFGDPVYADGFSGIAMTAGVQGDVVALEVEQSVHEITVPGTAAGTKGNLLYITKDGNNTLTDTASSNQAFGRVVKPRDANNVAWVRLAAQ